MNKRVISIFFVFLIITSIVTPNAEAAQTKERQITYLPDGGYIETYITIIASRASYSVTGKKHRNQYNSDGDLEWSATLSGTFTYDGKTSSCTSSSCSVSISNTTNWSLVSKSASKSSNTANATITMAIKALGIIVDTPVYNLTLSCDANGNLS